jgi:hypothetical protein
MDKYVDKQITQFIPTVDTNKSRRTTKGHDDLKYIDIKNLKLTLPKHDSISQDPKSTFIPIHVNSNQNHHQISNIQTKGQDDVKQYIDINEQSAKSKPMQNVMHDDVKYIDVKNPKLTHGSIPKEPKSSSFITVHSKASNQNHGLSKTGENADSKEYIDINEQPTKSKATESILEHSVSPSFITIHTKSNQNQNNRENGQDDVQYIDINEQSKTLTASESISEQFIKIHPNEQERASNSNQNHNKVIKSLSQHLSDLKLNPHPSTPFEVELQSVLKLLEIIDNYDDNKLGKDSRLTVDKLFSSMFKIVDVIQGGQKVSISLFGN